MTETAAMPPEPPAFDVEGRHAHLLGEIADARAGRARTTRSVPPGRQLAWVAVAVAALVAAGAAFAVGSGQLSAFFDRDANDPSVPHLVGGRAVVTSGDDWAYVAWKSTGGLCTAVVLDETDGGESCGMSVVGAGETAGEQHQVVGGLMQRRAAEDMWIDGVAADTVSRVQIELADGSRLEAPLYDAPPALGLKLKFFITRANLRRFADQHASVPGYPVAAFRAYDSDGRLLERFSMP